MTHSRRTAAAEKTKEGAVTAPRNGSFGTASINGDEPATEPLALLRAPDAKRVDPPAVPPLSLEATPNDPDWENIAPSGLYARHGKRLLNTLLLLATLPLALVLSLPIALINWAIFRDHRRILFSQPRIGRRGRTFSIYKFRTMRETKAENFDTWKDESDGLRVTRFGRFLRNTHLDELPQLINVLRGEMDFIGPRPEMIEIDDWACQRIADFHERNVLAPGITGFAQITHGYAGMDPVAYRQKLADDLYYKENLSLRLDLEILLRTAVWMLRGRGWRRKSPTRPAESKTA